MPPGDDDRAQIEALHARDERAALAQDREALAALWSKDGVMLAPGSRRLRGEELTAALQSETGASEFEVLEYRFDFEEVEVCGDYAFEWGTISGRSRDRSTGDVRQSSFKLMRILVREDGEWKVHRAMWNSLD